MRAFTSRKSILLGIFLWGILIITFILTNGHKGPQIFMWMLIYSLVGFLWFGLKYFVEGDLLTIKIGFIKMMSIKISEIKSISRSFNPISSPAASLKRLKIDFISGSILISPNYEEEFIEVLRNSNPDIYVNILTEPERSSALTRFVYSLL
ncbi:PH domain-containing protein [Ekhidna sp.]